MLAQKSKILWFLLYSLLVIIPASWGIFIYSSLWWKKEKVLKVGILYSVTGPNASIEQPLIDIILMAIEEINASGGVMGSLLEPIIADAMSQTKVYEREAIRLITKNKVDVIFGCLDSMSRKLVKTVVEQHKKLLIFPATHEGLEYSKNVIYTGMIPNQFVLPGIAWCLKNKGKDFYLVGSSSLFSIVVNEIAKIYINSIGGSVVGESYIPIDSKDFDSLMPDIEEKKPSVVINTLEVSSNIVFLARLYELNHKEGFNKKIASIMFNLYEDELSEIDLKHLASHYTAWSYFSGLDTEKNYIFKSKCHKKFGYRKVIGDLGASAYASVYLWTKAVQLAQSTDVDRIQKCLADISYSTPSGLVYFDNTTNHIWCTSRIGQITDTGGYKVVWSSGKPVEPSIYPFKAKEEWDVFLKKYLG